MRRNDHITYLDISDVILIVSLDIMAQRAQGHRCFCQGNVEAVAGMIVEVELHTGAKIIIEEYKKERIEKKTRTQLRLSKT